MRNSIMRYFSSTVTSKLQKRRDAFMKANYPEFAGGGTFMDPARTPARLDGSERLFNSEERIGLEAEFRTKVNEASLDPDQLSEVLNEYREKVEEFESSKRPMSEVKKEKIDQLTKRFDYSSSREGSPVRKLRTKRADEFRLIREEGESLMDPFAKSSISCESALTKELLEKKSAKSFVEMYGQLVPSVVGSSSLEEYRLAKSELIAFDESYRQVLSLKGQDSLFVLDHFATAAVRALNAGDAMETCLVDSKGYVMTTGLVLRRSAFEYVLVLAGNSKDRIFRYLSQYVVYSRQCGMSVSMEPALDLDVYSMYGPEVGKSHLIDNDKIFFSLNGELLPDARFVQYMPTMSFLSLQEGGILIKHFNHLLLIMRKEHVLPSGLLPKNFGGVYALDMLRMEAGAVRPDTDCPSASCSPIKASLAHLVDQKKVREKLLFGHERISADLLKGTSHKRVLIIASQYVYGGCKILSAPHRHVVGETTSCSWNPELKKRVCQAYVKPEFAAPNNPLFVNVPFAIPERIEYRFKRRIVRQGAFRSSFRKLVPALVSPTFTLL